LWNKKAQLSLTNPRDAKACHKLLQFELNCYKVKLIGISHDLAILEGNNG